MTISQTRRGEAAASFSLSTTPEERPSSSYSSQARTQFTASAAVAPAFEEYQGHTHVDENVVLMNIPRSLHVLCSPHASRDGYMDNYELFQPSVAAYTDTYIDHPETDYHQLDPLFSHSSYPTGIDHNDMASLSQMGVVGSVQDGSYSFFNTTIAPHQVYSKKAPVSDPSVPMPEMEHSHESKQQSQDLMESVEELDPSHFPSNRIYRQPEIQEVAKHQSPSSFDGLESGDDEDADEDADELKADEPYAKMLFRCLRQAPGHTMILRDIYDWFRANTERGSDPKNTGWMNSIRHNLSMNRAFEKVNVSGPEGGKKYGYQWRLSQQAIKEGCVQSTTRFRCKNPNKRGNRSHHPAPHRQASGARGGEMSRRSAIQRRSERINANRRYIEESRAQLRAQGILSRSPPRSGDCELSSDCNLANIHSRPASPYFQLPENTRFSLLSQQHDEHILSFAQHSPAMQHHGSYPSSPELGIVNMHFGPLGQSLFYPSPGSLSAMSSTRDNTPEGYCEILYADTTPFANFENEEDLFAVQ